MITCWNCLGERRCIVAPVAGDAWPELVTCSTCDGDGFFSVGDLARLFKCDPRSLEHIIYGVRLDSRRGARTAARLLPQLVRLAEHERLSKEKAARMGRAV